MRHTSILAIIFFAVVGLVTTLAYTTEQNGKVEQVYTEDQVHHLVTLPVDGRVQVRDLRMKLNSLTYDSNCQTVQCPATAVLHFAVGDQEMTTMLDSGTTTDIFFYRVHFANLTPKRSAIFEIDYSDTSLRL